MNDERVLLILEENFTFIKEIAFNEREKIVMDSMDFLLNSSSDVKFLIENSNELAELLSFYQQTLNVSANPVCNLIVATDRLLDLAGGLVDFHVSLLTDDENIDKKRKEIVKTKKLLHNDKKFYLLK